MFEARPTPARKQLDADNPALFGDPSDGQVDQSKDELEKGRHRTLMECLDWEASAQAEERNQMQIDDDYYHHRQWRMGDAQVLMDRGQAPLVYNQARQTIDWLAGTDKRTEKDYKVLPRKKEDSQGAETKTQVLKYAEDVNNARFHRSGQFKVTALSGLGWMEVNINDDPTAELLYIRGEDWRNVYRDSRDRTPDLEKSRYLFRRKRLDLDYACALLPKAALVLRDASDDGDADTSASISGRDKDVWYLGQNLTNAAETDQQLTAGFRGERSSFVGSDGGYTDRGRRRSVDIIEAWYRVPVSVDMFQGGNFHREEVDLTNPQHVAEKARTDVSCYKRVKMQMRVMICTYDHVLWDGPSPFKHQKFTLVPMWAYRRGIDGMAYGVMRGMRDPQDSYNKKMSKANWLMSTNRILMDEGAHNDIEELREEAARPDGIIVKQGGESKKLTFEKPVADFSMALQMAGHDLEQIRASGGVTDENLGRDTNAQSGKAIGLKQNQGALATFELFDNQLLCIQLCGQIALSLMEQYYSEAKVLRIVGRGKPITWLPINTWDEESQSYINDITATQCDFIVDTQDYRATLQEAAMEQLFELMSKIAAVAPQIVIAILDIMVDSTDVPNKDQIVARIRKVNGQRDDTREMTPDEQAQQQAGAQKQAKVEQQQFDAVQVKIDEAKAKIKSMSLADSKTFLDALLVALEGANIAVTVPGVTPAADTLAEAAGLNGTMPGAGEVPAGGPVAVPQNPAPAPAAPSALQSTPAAAAVPQ